jgi:hypothetical protein
MSLSKSKSKSMTVGVSMSVVTMTLLTGCSPEYNWREVRPTGQGYQVMFPAKPGAASRDVNVEGEKLAMSLSAAQAGGNSFSVGVMKLSRDSAADRERVLAALRVQMLRNIGAIESAAVPIKVPVLDAQGRALAPIAALRIEARAKAPPNQLLGGFVARGDRVYQFLVIGLQPDPEQAQTFIESFRLLE